MKREAWVKMIDKRVAEFRAALTEAYLLGQSDAKAEMLALLSGRTSGLATTHNDLSPESPAPTIAGHEYDEDDDETSETVGGRKRAPKGLPRALTDRVLSERNDVGSSPQDILEAAQTDYERMIKVSTIRGELRKGLEDGRYTERNGLWYIDSDDDASL
ncbi:MAG: hypothetical protein GC146_16750 [Limimaricola sp.]|uniref:hypothetical protein n=1 Tax=Limimaricola sp. TaxID=2211665 RepID=UPI001D6B958D|nr:hypothetical protein [Limimaricola sp.]MBI1418868.1 hypothetical protein [Limimaricola sp.]